ncbi:ABC transporter ATP-binding protein [Vineibacter terrae]|uniref:ABC transporter ATP-binding protein n=1 Tax=Vineibacter terrae TaxID=2586908 RepID=A0A5C8PL86_9HYPH|nr:ABC transporter ATP-binding protein [Vineibacter terrae]TXL74480.1 ABC transporter ATP-binding protein [Vineibacter terrae]
MNAPSTGTAAPPLLDVRGLQKYFPITRGLRQRVVAQVRAVDGVDFTISEGETLGLVGESGCGKTTASRCILRAIDPTGGAIVYRTRDGRTVDLAALSPAALRPLRAEIQMIFQDPFSSLNPRMTLLDNVGEPLLVNGMKNRRERAERVAELLRLVGLRPEFMHRFPHAFSGGQRQRIGIARALATSPRLVVADEPVSALDVSVQAQVLNLLLELQSRLKLTFLFVAHDLSVVRHICDRIAVMYVGQLVELAPTDAIFGRPQHPYTAALMRAVPVPDPRVRSSDGILGGEVPSPAAPPSGCYFHPRCRHAQERCRVEAPALREIAPDHMTRCHRAGEVAF